MAKLEKLSDNIWTAWTHLRFFGLHIGTRMTVVRLENGGLWLHSPILPSADLRNELDALGPVQHIICPNRFHHLHANEAKAAYPGATLHAPHSLRRKRTDLQIDADLSQSPEPAWEKDLDQVAIRGSLVDETVFYHIPSRTLITSDFIENFSHSDHWPTRLYLKFFGLYGRTTWGWHMRFVYRDRKLARACIDRVLQWPFERVVIAHGDLILSNAHESVTRGLAWLTED